MAQIALVMQAKAALDASWQEAGIFYQYDGLEAATRSIRGVLEEAEKRCMRVLLEEEEMPATTMSLSLREEEEMPVTTMSLSLREEEEMPATTMSLSLREEEESIGDWLRSVKNVADNIRAFVRKGLRRHDDLGKIITRLEELEREYERFGYTKGQGLPLASCWSSRVGQRSFIITDVLPQLGRERYDDKRRIIDNITQQAETKTQTDEPVILPILGPAGVGKTTLVKSIFHDPQLFPGYAKTWVDTPEGQDDLKKIYSSLVSSSQALQGAESSSTTEQDDDGYSLDYMRNRIVGLLADKKLLLVLDDLWVKVDPLRNEDDDDLSRMDDLKRLLCGIGGNLVVLVTTPNKSIAGYITSTAIKPYQLHPLSHETCWAIIKQTSGFEARIAGANHHQEADAAERIGREIASKCCGLPLAAKAIGRTMHSLDIPQGWSALVEDTWNIARGYSGDSQLPLHTLAVLCHFNQAYHMSPAQWRWFATCAFCFSKGRSILRHDMFWLWTGLSIDYHGRSSFLLDRFLLHENSASNARAIDAMLVSADDITYDFASYVLGDRLMVVDGRRNNADLANRSSNAYLAVISNWDANQPLDLSSILPAGIKALRFEDCPAIMELSDGAFVSSSTKHLKVLDLSGCSLKKLPESIGELEPLRYLNAPGIQDRVLPLWLTTRLRCLEYLSLRGSTLLADLTESFGSLDGLKHLDLSGCSGLKALPDSFQMLHSLEHLDLSGCSGLRAQALPESFGRLDGLKHLDLSGWSCVGGITEALQRFHLEELHYLNLSHRCTFVEGWFHLTNNLDKVLPQIKELRSLVLSSCLNPLCYTSIPDKSNSYVDGCIRDLVKLQHLDLSQNTFLEQLPESIGHLKQLRSLDLSGCFRLDTLPESIADLKELRSLDLSGCFRLDRLPERIGELEELQTLDLSGCPQLDPLPEEVTQKLSHGSLTIITDHEEYHLCQAATSTCGEKQRCQR